MNGKRPVVPEGFVDDAGQVTDLAPYKPSGGNSKVRFIFGVLWSSLGSIFVVPAPVLANVLIAFGAMVAWGSGGRRERGATLLSALVAGCLSAYLLVGVYSIPMSLVSILCAFALSWSYASGRLHTAGLLLAVLTVTLVMIGVDATSTALQGTSITELVTKVVDETVESYVGTLDLEGKTVLLETRESLLALWPSVYLAVGVGIALCSLFGAWVGAKANGIVVPAMSLASYDVPLWVAEAFAVGVVAEMLGPRLPAWQTEAVMVGANVVMYSRFALVQQGLSVLLWRMRERRVAVPARTLAVLVALWLEMSFALTSVLGLLDVAVNFRRLRRNRADLVPRPTRER